jgi:hypothetical protein
MTLGLSFKFLVRLTAVLIAGPRDFQARSQNCEKQLSASSSVYPSAGMENLVSHWTDFHEIWYQSTFRKPDQKSPVALKSGKNNA